MTAPAGRPSEAALPAEASGAAVLRHALARGVAALQADRAAALAGDAEAVHRMRIAVRRMRAALRAFRPLLRGESLDHARPSAWEAHARPAPPARAAAGLAARDARLRALGNTLGPARDWDVFLEETLVAAAKDLPPPLIATLRAAAAPRRSAAYAALRRALDDPARLARLGNYLGSWADRLDRGAFPALEAPVTAVAPALLRRMDRQARRRARGIEHASVEALHALRKSVKRLRYATELLGPYGAPQAGRAAVAACKTLQDLLGRVNDAAVTPDLAAGLAAGGGSARRPDDAAAETQRHLVAAIAAMAAWAGARGERARRRLPKALAALRDAPAAQDHPDRMGQSRSG